MDEILAKLNEEQIKPVLDTEGAVLVIAGAGSGKTRVLTSRIAHLIKDLKVSPHEILAITFTNKAANEMKERISRMVGEEVDDMWACTIHSMCVRILRMEGERLGYTRDFSIYSDADKDRVLKKIIELKGYDEDGLLKSVKGHISSAKSKGFSAEEYKAEYAYVRNIDLIAAVMEDYAAELKRCNALDFDDLLIMTEKLLAVSKEARLRFAGRFRYVHVDEFQDVNAVQYKIIKHLCSVHGNVFAVGDDDQSIYGWRGADIKNILNFEDDFANAKVYKLERNYRSTKRILNLANLIIQNNLQRKDKKLWTENDEGGKVETYSAKDETDEAAYIATQIREGISRYDYSPGDFAVLMRINALSRPLEQEFLKYGIPYKVFGGFKFYERKEIKDLTAYLRILSNPLDDEAILRVINVPKRGIGAQTVSALVSYAAAGGLSVFDAVMDCDELGLAAGAKAKLSGFKQIILSLIMDKELLPLGELIRSVVEKTQFLSQFPSDSDEDTNKRANVDEFLSSADEFERSNLQPVLSDFLNSITLSSDLDEMNGDSFVTLATVHAVKGLEFKNVFICGVDDSIFPISRARDNDDEMEEERRLMYVAITRAERRLCITRASSRYLNGSRSYYLKSPFFAEMSAELGQLRENRGYRDEYSGGSYSDCGDYRSYGSEPDYLVSAKKAPVKNFYSYKTERKEKPAEKPLADVAGYRAGAKVKHVKFGEGTVVAVKGEGANKIVDVAFPGFGVKSLSARFAPMQVIDG